ncbi:MAG: hypothetical protein DMF82_16225 [Acidobacteria bacterium]|nr:MAG: hypothetical protein DMF82_16225 [Acidobacteriota bacterium]
MSIWPSTAVGALFAACVSIPAAGAAPGHDRAFWSGIAKNRYQVPAGESADALVVELGQLLGSPDPELRDDFAYSIAAAWIYRDRLVSEKTLRELARAWSANLRVGLGGIGSDTLFLRAFSALDLSLLAALDHQHPFLADAEYAGLLSAALDYLAGEKDLRAFDPRRGWMHATAHTADLLKFLGRNARLRPADQGRILDAIAAKLRVAGTTFSYGENERLAAAVQSLVQRKDLDAAAFARFLAAVAEPAEHLWDQGSLVDPLRFAATQNAKDLLRSLYVRLMLDKGAPDAPRAEILKMLEKLGG